MKQTALITQVTENSRSYNFNGKTYFVHNVQFDGDPEKRIWEYHSTSDKCLKFKVGETSTFETESKSNGKYTIYKIKPIEEQQGGFKQPQKDTDVITYLSCFSSVCNLHSGTNYYTDDDIFDMTEKAFQRAISKKAK